MYDLQIIIAPDPRLLKVSAPVTEINQETKNLLDKMLEVMYKSNGIGLAAPQVGILKRLIVMDCSDKNTNKLTPTVEVFNIFICVVFICNMFKRFTTNPF